MEFSLLQSPPSRPAHLGLRWMRDRSLLYAWWRGEEEGDLDDHGASGDFIPAFYGFTTTLEHQLRGILECWSPRHPGRTDLGYTDCTTSVLASVLTSEPCVATCIQIVGSSERYLPYRAVTLTSDPFDARKAT